jgi:hypothetical protein
VSSLRCQKAGHSQARRGREKEGEQGRKAEVLTKLSKRYLQLDQPLTAARILQSQSRPFCSRGPYLAAVTDDGPYCAPYDSSGPYLALTDSGPYGPYLAVTDSGPYCHGALYD